jgi:hypothetical protein
MYVAIVASYYDDYFDIVATLLRYFDVLSALSPSPRMFYLTPLFVFGYGGLWIMCGNIRRVLVPRPSNPSTLSRRW